MSGKSIGARTWAIAEGSIPAWSHGPEPEFTSHETACILNTNDTDAHVEVTIYFKDREPHSLLPKVRAASADTLIIADGFSCREQIRASRTFSPARRGRGASLPP